MEQRKGRITTSEFHEVHIIVKTLVAGCKKVVKIKPLIARIVHHQSLNNVPAMQWGRAHEKDASDAFVKTRLSDIVSHLPQLLSNRIIHQVSRNGYGPDCYNIASKFV